ncbi:helix-turn-helix domain-containing protein [Nocardiopsis alba]|uniref:helix-turn-helix domain-containing protein n=1 Tax=Nocardiopsis alba TaxID=53437 RepID=UPI003D7359E5
MDGKYVKLDRAALYRLPPEDRFRAALKIQDEARDQQNAIRAEAVAELRKRHTVEEIAELLGVATGRVYQLLRDHKKRQEAAQEER